MRRSTVLLAAGALWAGAVEAQTFARPEPVLQQIWQEGTTGSRLRPLAQALLDSIGPRLTGTPGMRAGQEWLLARYREWGIEARNEPYGSWEGWRRGVTHVDLVEPRVRSLEGMMLAWSPGTRGPVRAPAVVLPQFATAEAFRRWLPEARGRFVLTSYAQPSCRPADGFERWGAPGEADRMAQERQQGAAAWRRRVAATGLTGRELAEALAAAGAAGIVTHLWSGGWGVDRIFEAQTRAVPTVDLSCEDYGLVFRLAENGQDPVLRLEAEAEPLGEVRVFNTIAVIPGAELPDEYVVLSAHFDSWDGASGATDNGPGTVTMMEAMRILKAVYPRPRRTILVGHWSGEEQGLNGSRAFAADHPEIVQGMQALFNQDNGTGRVVNISMQGFTGAGGHFARWLARIPSELSQGIRVDDPGSPGGGGSDYASFVCHGAPAFGLSSLGWDYGTYTWHTNRDTFDKIVWSDVTNNAILTAMLAYLASEDPERLPRARRPGSWPRCAVPDRGSGVAPR